MNRYKVTMQCVPVWAYVDAEDEEQAIDKAYDEDKWEGGEHYGGEEFKAVLVEKNISEK